MERREEEFKGRQEVIKIVEFSICVGALYKRCEDITFYRNLANVL